MSDTISAFDALKAERDYLSGQLEAAEGELAQLRPLVRIWKGTAERLGERAELAEAEVTRLRELLTEARTVMREVSSAEANYGPTLETDDYYWRRALAFQELRAFIARSEVQP